MVIGRENTVMDGIEAACHFHAEMPGIKILTLSIYSNDGFNSGRMRADALGYIVKGGDFEELSKAIRRAAFSLLHFYRKSSDRRNTLRENL